MSGDIGKKKAVLAKKLAEVKKDRNFIIDICGFLKTDEEVEKMIEFIDEGDATYSTVILKAVEMDRGH